jgi:hypothetical protein
LTAQSAIEEDVAQEAAVAAETDPAIAAVERLARQWRGTVADLEGGQAQNLQATRALAARIDDLEARLPSADAPPPGSFRSLTGWPLVLLISTPVVLLVLLVFQLYFIHELSRIGHSLRPSRNPPKKGKSAAEGSPSLAPLQEKLEELTGEIRSLPIRPDPQQDVAKSLRQMEEKFGTVLSEAVETSSRTAAETATAQWEKFLTEKREQEESDMPAEAKTAAAEAAAPSTLDALWPEFLLPGGPLAASRELLEKEMVDKNPQAVALFLALIDIQLALEKPLSSRAEFARRIHHFSRQLMRWAHKHEKAGQLPDPVARWREVYEKAVTAVYPSLSLRPSYPGTPFDTDTMVRDDDHSGNGGTVAVSLSWAIIDQQEDAPRVLQRALVITA